MIQYFKVLTTLSIALANFLFSQPIQRSYTSGFLSDVNTSTATVADGDTFTGVFEAVDLPDVGVSCQTDAAGTLFFDFSVDGTNWSTFPVGGFTVVAGIHEFHTAVKLNGRFFRVRLANNSGSNQTYLRLYTYYGVFRQGNAPIGSSINDDSDAINVKSVIVGRNKSGDYTNIGTDRFGNLMTSSFLIGVAKGEFPGLSVVHKFGRNSDVDTGTDPETIWEADGLKVWQTTAQTIDVVSTSVLDTDISGIGLHEIVIEGVDGNYAFVRDTVDLNGVLTTTSTQTFLNVYRVYGVAAGSAGDNAGTVSGEYSTTNDPAFGILPGFNQSQLAFYTTAEGETAEILQVKVLPFKQANAAFEVNMYIREFGGLFRLRETFGGHSQSAGGVYPFPIPFRIPEKSDIEFRLDETSSSNMGASVSFIILSEKE